LFYREWVTVTITRIMTYLKYLKDFETLPQDWRKSVGTQPDSGRWEDGTIFAKQLDGTTHVISGVSSNTSIGELKTRLRDASGTPVERQRVVFMGKDMSNERTLGECGVKPDNYVHVVIALANVSHEENTQRLVKETLAIVEGWMKGLVRSEQLVNLDLSDDTQHAQLLLQSFAVTRIQLWVRLVLAKNRRGHGTTPGDTTNTQHATLFGNDVVVQLQRWWRTQAKAKRDAETMSDELIAQLVAEDQHGQDAETMSDELIAQLVAEGQ
jgi:hypothetical protein